MNIAVIGYGYWGPNIVRNFRSIPDINVRYICDKSPDALKRAQRDFPSIELSTDSKSILLSADIDAVAVVTQTNTHYDIAKAALMNGKHVFVEKPFTSTSEEAEELIELGEKKGLTIMVDHTFLFTGAVQKMKELLQENELGELYYYDSVRVNLGLFQSDVNVVWDLLPHDISIIHYLTGMMPLEISAIGVDHFNHGKENIAYVSAFYENNLVAHFNMNWLSPVKVRRTLIGGARKMLEWNDLSADEKLKVYDRGVDRKDQENKYEALVDYRFGDIYIPKLSKVEALRAETEYFYKCVSTGERPINDGVSGAAVIRILEAVGKSMKSNGASVKI
jgi:predicted dehydrogenase